MGGEAGKNCVSGLSAESFARDPVGAAEDPRVDGVAGRRRRLARRLKYPSTMRGVLKIAYKLLVNDKGTFAALGGGWWSAQVVTRE